MTTATGVREGVRVWRARDSEVTASQMARGLGVSRARIRQLLVELDLPTITTRSPGAPPSVNLETARHMQDVLIEMDRQIRGQSVCKRCGRPTRGLQWQTHDNGAVRSQTRQEAGLCTCP